MEAQLVTTPLDPEFMKLVYQDVASWPEVSDAHGDEHFGYMTIRPMLVQCVIPRYEPSWKSRCEYVVNFDIEENPYMHYSIAVGAKSLDGPDSILFANYMDMDFTPVDHKWDNTPRVLPGGYQALCHGFNMWNAQQIPGVPNWRHLRVRGPVDHTQYPHWKTFHTQDPVRVFREILQWHTDVFCDSNVPPEETKHYIGQTVIVNDRSKCTTITLTEELHRNPSLVFKPQSAPDLTAAKA